MAFGKGRKKAGSSFLGVRTAPTGSFASGGRLEPNLVVSVTSISSITDWTDDVFHKPLPFSFRAIKVTSVRLHDTSPDRACRRLTLAADVARKAIRSCWHIASVPEFRS
jgi:hypothetical protein